MALLQRGLWQSDLSNCFPDLFAELDRAIESIEPGVLPNMSPETLTLAKRALLATNERRNVDIDEWAQKLASSTFDNSD